MRTPRVFVPTFHIGAAKHASFHAKKMLGIWRWLFCWHREIIFVFYGSKPHFAVRRHRLTWVLSIKRKVTFQMNPNLMVKNAEAKERVCKIYLAKP